jgi:hypothetical protein
METRASLAGGTLMSQADSYQTRERLRRLLEEEYPTDWLRTFSASRRYGLRNVGRDAGKPVRSSRCGRGGA